MRQSRWSTSGLGVRPHARQHGDHRVGKKETRHFDDILGEVERSIGVHERMGTHFGGVHFELTGEDVTECTGGAETSPNAISNGPIGRKLIPD